MGAANLGIDQGGSVCLDIRTDLLGSGTIGPAIQVRYVVPETAYAEGSGRIPPIGGPHTDKMATE